MYSFLLQDHRTIKMEEFILELNGKLLQLDKEKAENPMMDLSQRRSPILRQFIETFGENYDHILQENASLKAKNASLKANIVKVTEEHKSEMSLNAKTMNSIVKMHEKTQEALDEKTIELANIKQELQSVNLTNQIVKNEHSELEKNLIPVNQNKIKTEVKVEMKEEPSKDLHMVHDNYKQNAKLTKDEESEENLEMKKECGFVEMGIDLVTSKTFDREYLKSTENQEQEKDSQSSNNSIISFSLSKNQFYKSRISIFTNLRCCRVFFYFFNIKTYIGIFGCIVILI